MIINEVEYSYDCSNCKFHDFMKKLGINVGVDTCWIDCTKEIKEETDEVFDILLDYTKMNGDGIVIFTGNNDRDYDDFINERGLGVPEEDDEDIDIKCIKKWRS